MRFIFKIWNLSPACNLASMRIVFLQTHSTVVIMNRREIISQHITTLPRDTPALLILLPPALHVTVRVGLCNFRSILIRPNVVECIYVCISAFMLCFGSIWKTKLASWSSIITNMNKSITFISSASSLPQSELRACDCIRVGGTRGGAAVHMVAKHKHNRGSAAAAATLASSLATKTVDHTHDTAEPFGECTLVVYSSF